ncbi:MAG: hypothetical protein U0Y10_08310 [Spirosomataceae bacterium]
MKKYILLVVISLAFGACTSDNLSPAEKGLVGTYQAISDPLRCAAPTTQGLRITADGAQLKITYDYFGKAGYELSNVTTEEKDGETKLFYKGAELGKYVRDSYLKWNGKQFDTIEGMVLYLRYGQPQAEHIEFMGAK